MSKVVLIEPSAKYCFDPRWVRSPLGLLYLASAIRSANHYVGIVSQPLLGIDQNEIVQAVADMNPDVVGITSITPNYRNAIGIAKALKFRCGALPVILGGLHPTYMAEEILRTEPSVDIVVRKEGESTIVKLLAVLEKQAALEDARGISFREGLDIHHTPDQDFIADLDAIPAPARDLLPMEQYKKINPEEHILASRGCSAGCSFCNLSDFFGPTYRVRSPDNILEEVRVLIEQYGFRRIKFNDCVFTANRNWVLSLCEKIIRSGLRFSWRAQTRLDRLDREILRNLARAGCKEIMIGIESASVELLKEYRKGIDIDKVSMVKKWSEDAGLSLYFSFIIGAPSEDFATGLKTIRLAKELCSGSIRNPRISFLVPFPGTRVHKEVLGRNRDLLEIRDYDKFSQHIPVMKTRRMSRSELARLWAVAAKEIVFADRQRVEFYLGSLHDSRAWQQPEIQEYRLKEFEIQENRHGAVS
jgi:anaerobic magnesium-protoporphyrin IX monomethyl ester cyclase